MSNLRQAAQQALDFIVATNKSSQFWLVPESNLNKTVTALRAALAEPPTNQCGETCERANLCAVCARGLADGDKVAPTGCDHCNHPLYAAIKCSHCGRVTE